MDRATDFQSEHWRVGLVVSLDKKLCSTLSLFIQVLLGVSLGLDHQPHTGRGGGVAILLVASG